ncbi:MAG: sulfotransferase family protein [Phycisphaera sp.]|nr:MAG: sulfotransferase family protein [Phycisphaera sp.]
MATLTGRDDEVLAFLHVTKTGGRTLQRVLKDILRSEGGQSRNFDGSLRARDEFVHETAECRNRYDLLHGHFQFGIHDYIDRPVRYITLLRNPVDRVVSQYYHILEDPRHYLHSIVTNSRWSLIDFIENSLPRDADNGTIRCLTTRSLWHGRVGDVTREELDTARSNLFEQVSVFGLTERFDESLILMAERFGWPDEFLRYERRNVTKRPHTSDLSAVERRAVDAITELEQELFQEAREKLDQIIREQPAAFRARLERFVRENPGSNPIYDERGVRIDGVHCSQS